MICREIYTLFFLHILLISFIISSIANHSVPFYPKDSRVVIYNSEYLFIPNIIKPKTDFKKERITLVLHCSHDYFSTNFSKQLENWDGPISLGIFLHTNKIHSFETLCTYCNLKKIPNIEDKSQIHFIYRATSFLDGNMDTNINDYFSLINCNDTKFLESICHSKKQTENQKIKNMINYPVNVVRNIARKMTFTKYILLADFDHMFSKNFEAKMVKVANKELKKDENSVLVYRIFEVDENVTNLPENKTSLFSLMSKKKANIFHSYYPMGHAIPGLYEWINTKDSDNPTIQFEAKYSRAAWEPQFVSTKSIPFHDENFLYPLRDNTNLRWTMCRKGYRFLVVNDVFMYHIGIKQENAKLLTAKARQWIYKRMKTVVNEYNKRLDELYPETKKKCPPFTI
ncbi:N-acetyllactosaminide beta-1,3-N-acetylglucosaminyltransferase [Strongyloides ratti]|uniref:N-acetyllactosaminide beta-1,3-N-acetylglucosaminyltransferase n=1 Tax=Strongyloides ratti TaxID=34506 RepID=A0A090LG89_STRRB|nr:N-acetyllactosaminide beta-1,3-N-acetylglucosaminyltransferase [Strongyloides ratti]CEF68806.1 N-acetyllactosaminide beta-1,3-N-acetylglucosaminyltransferase [Strongyloides ratti]